MILYALLNLIFLYLVTGQAFQIQSDLTTQHAVQYLFNFINEAGFNLGLWYVLWLSVMSFILALCSNGYVPSMYRRPRYSFMPSRTFYRSLIAALCATAFVLIFVVVGPAEFLHSSRPGYQQGATVFIVLLYLGIVPALLKVILQNKINRGDIMCLLISFGVTAAFSRIHVLLYLTAFLLAYFYAGGWGARPISASLVIKLVSIGLVAAIIFFGVGSLHSAQNFVDGNLGDLINYLLEHPEKSVLAIDYNYRVGVEGMSGIAGIFTQYLGRPSSVHHDWGGSWMILGAMQWIPGFLKAYAENLSNLSATLDWYPYSVVATGAETFFMSYGWFGVMLYPLSVYVLGWSFPLRLLMNKISPLWLLIGYTQLACSIFFVRGSLAVWLGFSFTYVVILTVTWPLFSRWVDPVQTREELG